MNEDELDAFRRESLALRTDPTLTYERWIWFVREWQDVEAVGPELEAVFVLGGLMGWELPEGDPSDP